MRLRWNIENIDGDAATMEYAEVVEQTLLDDGAKELFLWVKSQLLS